MVRCPKCDKDNPGKQGPCLWCGADLEGAEALKSETTVTEAPVHLGKQKEPAKQVINLVVAAAFWIIVAVVAFVLTYYLFLGPLLTQHAPSLGSTQLSTPVLETVGTNGVTADTTPWLNWNRVSGIDYYDVQVDSSPSFYSPVIDTISLCSSYTCEAFLPGTYYWRVRSADYRGNYSSWATGSFTVDLSATTSENYEYDIIHHEWDYGGGRWRFDLKMPKMVYEYFSERPRTSTYSEYVDNPLDDNWMTQQGSRIENLAENQGWGEFDTLSFVLAYVQSWPYTTDVTTSYDEYPRYPLETIVDGGGDCEDTSILFSSIVRGMGYGTVLLKLEEDDHMAVGLRISENIVNNWNQSYNLTYYTTADGIKYAYCETTGEGWELGHRPENLKSATASLISV